jgi:uridylate kinase
MQKKPAKKQKIFVVSLGGSVVYPYGESYNNGLDIQFLRQLREFLLGQAKKGRRFVIVVGGGKSCRIYQKAAREVLGEKKNNADLDWIGIQATRMNALFVAKILREISFPLVLDHEPGKKEINAFLKSNKKVLMVSGWEPGWSTDYDAMRCACLFGAAEVISASDAHFVCDKDPRKFPDAQPIKDLTWNEYQKLIPAKWVPGLSTPVDPVAAKVAKKNRLIVKKIKGNDIESFRKAVEGEDFEGSVIHN